MCANNLIGTILSLFMILPHHSPAGLEFTDIMGADWA
jgi:hypothetical protein